MLEPSLYRQRRGIQYSMSRVELDFLVFHSSFTHAPAQKLSTVFSPYMQFFDVGLRD